MKRRPESLQAGLVAGIGLLDTADFLRLHHSTPRILGYAAGIAVLLLVASLPRLRRGERGFAFLRSALSVSALAGVLLATMLVVHSWRWILFAAGLVAVALLGLGIEHMDDGLELSNDPEPAELRKPSSDVWQNLPRF